jgi:Ser/Thr protein kinase RdoA (MazF antagonist)
MPSQIMMKNDGPLSGSIAETLAAFNCSPNSTIIPVGNGLINKTYLVQAADKTPLLLQQINTNIFRQPVDIQTNYEAIKAYLEQQHYFIPPLIKTKNGELVCENKENEVWRAFGYIADSFSPNLVSSEKQAANVATCFGKFAAVMKNFPAGELKVILPHFHDLQWRYREFKDALAVTLHPVKAELKELVDNVQQRQPLVSVFERFENRKQFPLHVMHHDCKISNILFDKRTEAIICPVDLDTVMPGLFFSDFGDMIRTTCCTADENSTAWTSIGINKDFYEAVMTAYRSATKGLFTVAEEEHLPYAGLFLIYMQTMRFLTDHLAGNVYYKVQYAEHNLHRAKNQLLLLQSLEDLLQRKGFLLPY